MAGDLIVRTSPQGGSGVALTSVVSSLPRIMQVETVSESCIELKKGQDIIAILDLQFTNRDGDELESPSGMCNSILFRFEGSLGDHSSYLKTVQKTAQQLGWVIESDGEIEASDASGMSKPVKPIEGFEVYSPPEEKSPWWKFW